MSSIDWTRADLRQNESIISLRAEVKSLRKQIDDLNLQMAKNQAVRRIEALEKWAAEHGYQK